MELYGEEEREEVDRGDQEEERNPASNQFLRCSPPSGTHRDSQSWIEKRWGRKERLHTVFHQCMIPQARIPSLPYPRQHLFLVFFDNCHFYRCDVVAHCSFDWHFLDG